MSVNLQEYTITHYNSFGTGNATYLETVEMYLNAELNTKKSSDAHDDRKWTKVEQGIKTQAQFLP